MSKPAALFGKVVAANTLAVGTTVVGGVLCVLFVGVVWAVKRWWSKKGGEKAGKVGRGAANKIPFVIAVETRDGKPIHTQLRCVAGFTKEAITAYASANIAAGTRVLSDGLACFGGVVDAGMKHTAIVTGGASGLGAATARMLARLNAVLYMPR